MMLGMDHWCLMNLLSRCTAVYLSDPIEGGETVFPEGSQWVNPAMEVGV